MFFARKSLFYGSVLVFAMPLFVAGCQNPAGGTEQPVFVPVTRIDNVPTGGVAGIEVDLSVAAVVPSNADDQSIAWAVKDAGSTGLTSAGIVNAKFTPAGAGTLKLTATIANGAGQGAPFARDFEIIISAPDTFVPVTRIDNVPADGVAGSPMSLAGATVIPDTATYNTISWVVTDDGGVGVTNAMLAAGSFTPAVAGVLKLTARIASGKAEGTPYTQDFTIDIERAFIAVTNITGIPGAGNAVTGTPLDLNSGVSVVPSGATNTVIVWSVKTPGDTGLTDADVASGVFTPANAGTVTLTAIILNGLAEGSNFTKDATITIIKPVTAINGVPTNGTMGHVVSLAGAVVEPAGATNKTIVWTIQTPGAGVNTISANSFTPTGTGDLTLRATIDNGSAVGVPFTQDFVITINEPGAIDPQFGLGDDTSIALRSNKSGVALLSKNTPILVSINETYYVSIADSGCIDVVWYLNGTKQTAAGNLIYLDTSKSGSIKLSVEGIKNNVLESSGIYTFEIVD